jgi:co-chaperonin GroES (HSP10)
MEIQGKSVLILPEENPDKTSRGILIPKTVGKIKPIGKVIDCGKSCVDVKKGDRVQYAPKNGSLMNIKGVEHHSILEDHIYYIYGSE